jgi:hypothetical protein
MFNFFERTRGVCAPTEIYWAKQKHNKQKTRVSKKEKVPPSKDENGRKRSKTDLQYRKTKAVGSGYFYI